MLIPDVSIVMNVPIYLGDAEVTRQSKGDDFSQEKVPVTIFEAEGVKIVLGVESGGEVCKPDVQIERRPNGWAIFLHPLAGCDPCGVVYFHDDGRSFFVHESEYENGTPRLEVAKNRPKEIDN